MRRPIDNLRATRRHLLVSGLLWCFCLVLLLREDDTGGWMALSGWHWTLFWLWIVSGRKVDTTAVVDTAEAFDEADG